MAEAVHLERQAARKLAARGVGLDVRQPRSIASQLRAMGREADIMVLPVDPGTLAQMQDTDPASPTYGETYYVAGFHPIGYAPLGG